MAENFSSYSVGVLVISDTVSAGVKTDSSGSNLKELLESEKYFRLKTVTQACVSDDIIIIQSKLIDWVDNLHFDLILTVGGTGFSPRDVTPEATKNVIQREAPHLASRMILGCCESTPFAVMSRSVCGMRGSSLILNLPGSRKGSQECFEMIANVLPHAIDQLKGKTRIVSELHKKIQDVDSL